MTRAEELSAALCSVRERVRRAAEIAGRDPGEIQLLPVTKFFPASDVEELYRLGCREFGESRDQEAAAKVALLDQAGHADIRWHMVGNLQRNKAKSVAHWAHSVHSVDNARLVTALDGARGAGRSGNRWASIFRSASTATTHGEGWISRLPTRLTSCARRWLPASIWSLPG